MSTHRSCDRCGSELGPFMALELTAHPENDLPVTQTIAECCAACVQTVFMAMDRRAVQRQAQGFASMVTRRLPPTASRTAENEAVGEQLDS